MSTARFSLTFILIAACSSPRITIELTQQADFESDADAGEPNLYAAPNGDVFLSWLARTPDGTNLMVATRSNGTWTEPVIAHQSNVMFTNWADFPSVTATDDGTWVVHWLEKTDASPYAYHARLSYSADHGQSWSEPVTIHADRSPSEHGFVNMVPGRNGTVDMIWLDGKATTLEPRGPMQVRHATLDTHGVMMGENAVDERVCDCCQTALVRSSEGLVAAYRDRSETDIRDVAVRVNSGSGWSDPVHVGNDQWHITGCPVNGPALSAVGEQVAIAWFAAPDRDERVQVAFSGDGGRTFGPPIRIDDGFPLGRVDIEFVNDQTAFVAWLERVGEEAAIRGITVRSDGTIMERVTLAPTSQARQGGFPRLARSGNELLIAHRVLADSVGTIRVLRATLDQQGSGLTR